MITIVYRRRLKIPEKDLNSQHVIFSLGEQKYSIDVMDSREIITTKDLTFIPEAPFFVEGVINLREQIIPIINLDKKLNLNINIDNNKVIIISVNNELVGLMVEEVIGINGLDQEDINDAPEITKEIDANYISGIAKLNDELIIIIKSSSILKNKELKKIKNINI